MTGPDDDPRPDPDDEAFARALLREVGRHPEPLPEDVATRLDDVLAGLVAERAGGVAGAPEPAGAIPIERARRRRRRATQALTAAAVVVVVGYAGGQLLVQGGSGDDMTSSDAGGAVAPEAAESDASGSSGDGAAGTSEDAFPLTSDGLRADARRLVASDTTLYRTRLSTEVAPDATSDRSDLGGTPRSLDDPGEGPDRAAALAEQRAEQKVERPGRDVTCVDPLVPAALTRLSVTYDGAAATAVLRPLDDADDATDATDGDRLRVEVWDCATPRRVASVVVRR